MMAPILRCQALKGHISVVFKVVSGAYAARVEAVPNLLLLTWTLKECPGVVVDWLPRTLYHPPRSQVPLLRPFVRGFFLSARQNCRLTLCIFGACTNGRAVSASECFRTP
jgi:hypothetical protein